MTLLLAVVAVGLIVAAFVYWMGLIKRVEIGDRRWLVSGALGIAMLLALAALTLGSGIAVRVLGGASLLLGALYFGLLALAGQSRQNPAVAVGEPLLDFTARDHNGVPFSLSSLAGRPVLLKFFRGHW